MVRPGIHMEETYPVHQWSGSTKYYGDIPGVNQPERWAFKSIRTLPGIGRLGQLVNSESRTGKVRSLIWQGVSQLVLPHEPLNFPDGSEDRLNLVRPLIGYGPESMFVAFNRFYPPELTEVEKRNAAPDRSHNEIWDSMVFSGLIGLTATLLVFGGIVLYCLKRIGFITDRKGLITFYLSSFGGGIFITAILLIWKGTGYFGVGLPLGLVLGVIFFIIISTHRTKQPQSINQRDLHHNLIFLGLLAAIMAHSVEFNFWFWNHSNSYIFLGVCGTRSGIRRKSNLG